MIASQMPIEEKRALADHVIDNSGSRGATRKRVEEVWEGLLRGGHPDRPASS
jgi:dephospho-CoA kinase